MSRTKHARVFLTLFLVFALFCFAAASAEVRYHGVQLDEQNRLIIEQEAGVLRVGLLRRTGFEGGMTPSGPLDEAKGESGRRTEAEFLMEIRSEVVKPSAPNYFNNPGETYRITVQGLEVLPDYHQETVVAAAKARDVVVGEFQQFWRRSHGIYRQAFFEAAPLALQAFETVERMPGQIMKSVLESRSGRFRITPLGLQRRAIQPAQTFAPEFESGAPEAGATMRQRQREALPQGATSVMLVRGIGTMDRPAGPMTPAAAAAMEVRDQAVRAAAARTGTVGRAITWAPAGASMGMWLPDIPFTQRIGPFAP